MQPSVLSRLESIVGGEGLAGEPSAFAVDGLTPEAVVRPSSYEQVAEVMRYAHAEGLAVIPWGGGAHLHIGNVPARYDIALSLSRLDQVVEHEPADLTVSCQAGITLAALQRHLAQHGQRVPLDPPGDDHATIGGILAANASGPSRHAYGTLRDFTIGLRVVTADGRLTKAGGRVVKNVAGYDLCKLYIGSLSTLGVIVEATFKLAPLPRAERTVGVAFLTAAEACAFAADLQRRGLSLRAAQLLNERAASAARLPSTTPFLLLLDLAGSKQAVDRSMQDVRDLAPSATAHIPDRQHLPDAQPAPRLSLPEESLLLCKASLLPTQVPALISELEAIGQPHITAWPTVGVVYASWSGPDEAEETVRRLRAETSALGGSLLVERCPLDLKRRLDVFPDVPAPALELMRRVKEQFDPEGVLSPGRHVRRL